MISFKTVDLNRILEHEDGNATLKEGSRFSVDVDIFSFEFSFSVVKWREINPKVVMTLLEAADVNWQQIVGVGKGGISTDGEKAK